MKQVYQLYFTQLNDKKDTVLINVPDMNILTEGFGLPDAIEMALRRHWSKRNHITGSWHGNSGSK